MKPKKNECLEYAGGSMPRGQGGAALPENTRPVLAGMVFNDLQVARERFAAKKAGRPQPPKESGIPLFALVGTEDVNPKTGFTHEEERAIREFAKDMMAVFSKQKQEMEAVG